MRHHRHMHVAQYAHMHDDVRPPGVLRPKVVCWERPKGRGPSGALPQHWKRERSLASRARAGARRGAERGSSVGGGMSEELDKHITRKYEVSHKLGKGAYGIVWKATEKKTSKVVALKKVFDAFQNSTDAQRTYREVVYLLQMNHENIVDLIQVLKADNDKDIYLVFEYMETDLHATIRANILEEIHKQYIMYQGFNALKYMHSANIVHRDMKPANLLLNSECLMKVADFGLARTLSDIGSDQIAEGSNKDSMTDYVATRWYRAPEILVGSLHYGYCADLWSLGCIFGEMVNVRAHALSHRACSGCSACWSAGWE